VHVFTQELAVHTLHHPEVHEFNYLLLKLTALDNQLARSE
jgi:hypothetical protein